MSKKWWEFWRSEAKHFSPSYIRTVLMRGTANWTAFDFIAYAAEGYGQNPTVRACIDAKARAATDCPMIATRDGANVERHPLLDLMRKPNPMQSWGALLKELLINYDISGEAILYVNRVGRMVELISLRPDWVTISSYQNGMPATYTFSGGDEGNQYSKIYQASEIIIFKHYNPLDRWRGLSPLASCAFAIDTLNSYAESNKATLDNGVTPSGVLSTASTLEDEPFKRLQQQFTDKYAGSKSSGKPMLLEGGLTWQQTGISPREMEYINGKRANELDVCKSLRVPPQMVGIEGSQTFANYEQARAAFYEDEVIPTVNELLSEIVRGVGFNDGVTLTVDVDAVTALEPRRAERNKTLDAMQSLTVNEKREQMGYDSAEGGDQILIASTLIPLDLAGADLMQGEGGA